MKMHRRKIQAVFDGIDPLGYLMQGGYAAQISRPPPTIVELVSLTKNIWETPDATVYTVRGSNLVLEFTYYADGRYSHDSLWPVRANRKNLKKYSLNFLSKLKQQSACRYPQTRYEVFTDGIEAIVLSESGSSAHYHRRDGSGDDYVLSTIYGANDKSQMTRDFVIANFLRLADF